MTSWEIKKINSQNKEFSFLFEKIPDPPKEIYFAGALPSPKDNLFAIVGTRRCSNYGRSIAFNVARDLARIGFVIVSGMAQGIDTSAHKGALEAQGRTIAVLGTGLDKESLYPKTNLSLAEKIIKTGGALFSEYPPGTTGKKFTFLKRNRIVAGLSKGVLVVEAPLRSGSLHTARIAISQKKPVFAVPGSVYSSTQKGCHLLIKEKNAMLIESAQDILKALSINSFAQSFPQVNKLIFSSSQEKKIYDYLLKNGPQNVDSIIENTKLNSNQVLSLLGLMELEKKIKKIAANLYTVNQ